MARERMTILRSTQSVEDPNPSTGSGPVSENGTERVKAVKHRTHQCRAESFMMGCEANRGRVQRWFILGMDGSKRMVHIRRPTSGTTYRNGNNSTSK